uniref:Uncharacterized protein n=1 Tax=Arundo donax TaxID=35708 RepID=A0A0A8ZP30_ARUDO
MAVRSSRGASSPAKRVSALRDLRPNGDVLLCINSCTQPFVDNSISRRVLVALSRACVLSSLSVCVSRGESVHVFVINTCRIYGVIPNRVLASYM